MCLVSRAQHSLSMSRFRFPTVEAFFLWPSLSVTHSLPRLFSSSLLSLLVCFPSPLSILPLPTTRHSCCWITEQMWRAPCRMGRRTTQRPLYSWPRLQVQSHPITSNHIPIPSQTCGSCLLSHFDPSVVRFSTRRVKD